MTELQIDDFIKKVLKGFWPRWNVSDVELQEWSKRLRYFDYEKGKKAVAEVSFNCSQNTIDPPKVKIFVALNKDAKITSVKEASPENEPAILFSIKNIDTDYALKFAIAHLRDLPSPQECEERAFSMLRKVKETYKGEYVIDRLWEELHNPVQKENNGLRGQAAFDKAVADILNYQKWHKTRIWLKSYIETTKGSSNEPFFLPALKIVPPATNKNNEINRQKELLCK